MSRMKYDVTLTDKTVSLTVVETLPIAEAMKLLQPEAPASDPRAHLLAIGFQAREFLARFVQSQ